MVNDLYSKGKLKMPSTSINTCKIIDSPYSLALINETLQ